MPGRNIGECGDLQCSEKLTGLYVFEGNDDIIAASELEELGHRRVFKFVDSSTNVESGMTKCTPQGRFAPNAFESRL
jgi:hypothetical protein